MDSPIQYLRDIRGLDPIGWWPPAPGWWLAAGLFLIILAATVWLWRLGPYPLRTWRWDAWRKLRRLRLQMDSMAPKEVVSEFSELLRRIAIARLGRRSCAGLADAAWLEWLTKHDPMGFDWNTKGRILLELPYAPADLQTGHEDLRELIDAALGWAATKEAQPRRKRSDSGNVWSWFRRPVQLKSN